jgi:anti-sigma regulatory factor (Ser/Thr protein kinase)
VRTWREPDAVVCEVSDSGAIADPLAGRVEPRPDQLGGRGLWVANHLCDLVQIRSSPSGTVARVRMGQLAAV